METTVVRLNPEGGVSSFQEAFGEYSEAGGRGRARRKARKARKNQRNEAKIARKDQKVQARVDRKQRRVDTRLAKKEARMDKRDERGSMLGNILTGGISGLAKRAKNRRGKKGTVTEETVTETETTLPEEQTTGQVGDGGGSGEYQEQGGGYESQGGSGYAEPQGGYQDGGEEQGYEDEGYEEDGGSDEGEYEEDYQTSDEENYDEEGYGADGSVKGLPINPKVKSITEKIEWNIELIRRMNLRIKALRDSLYTPNIPHDQKANVSKQITDLAGKVEERQSRIKQLEEMLGSYSNASGGRGKRKRNAEIKAARLLALAKMKESMARRKQGGGKEIPVDKELDTSVQPNKIVVDLRSEDIHSRADGDASGTGTGIIAIDQEGDIDAPDTRKFDLKFSNVEGEKAKKVKKIAVGVLIGVGAAALLIIAAKKLKWIK